MAKQSTKIPSKQKLLKYDEDSGLVVKRRMLQGGKYEYYYITGFVKPTLDIEDHDTQPDEVDIEDMLDRPINFFMRIGKIRDVPQLEYLVFHLMGYELNEMTKPLGMSNPKEVLKLGLRLQESLKS
jgi:hypothetical protein